MNGPRVSYAKWVEQNGGNKPQPKPAPKDGTKGDGKKGGKK